MDPFLPIQKLADLITRDPTLNFFIYDVIKIGILLVLINLIMAITRYYLPIEKLKKILTERNWYGLDYLLAAILGMITPFCSCSSIPLFIGFLNAGIPIGVTFTFLIASPLINESSLFLFPAIFGLKTTLLYNAIGMAVSIIGGYLIQKIGGEKYVNTELLKIKTKTEIIKENNGEKIALGKLVKYWWNDSMGITRKIFPYVILGVGVGALIHGFVPEDFIERILSGDALWTVPLATVLGVPLYANSVSVIPIIEALVDKGIPLGTAMAFMTATVTLSIPEALILKKIMKWQLLVLFFGITTFGIILIGLIFNLFL
ncbi:permease [Candidatus Dojkabacteria bacterium]|nr:permease [Candidatus Dojkabacteria bacterium]